MQPFVYIKNWLEERRAKRAQETPADSAARRTTTATVWMAAFTVVLAILSSLTLVLLYEGGIDTHALAKASEDTAIAAQKNADAAHSFAQSADKIREETAHAVTELRRAANDSEDSLKENSRNAQNALNVSIEASKLDERAWFGISDFDVVQYDPSDPKKPFRIQIFFRNSGKTPARQIHMLGIFNIYNSIVDGPTDADWNIFMSFFNQNKERYVAAPNASRKSIQSDSSNHIVTQSYPSIKDHASFVYYYGQATYIDVDNRPHTTKFCLLLAEPEMKQLAHCGKGNDMD
jgi:hypothetical protein